LVSLSIGNGPLFPEDKLTHTHSNSKIIWIGQKACVQNT
jgi:hypothetical protein